MVVSHLIWALGTEARSSVRAAHALSQSRSLSPASCTVHFRKCPGCFTTSWFLFFCARVPYTKPRLATITTQQLSVLPPASSSQGLRLQQAPLFPCFCVLSMLREARHGGTCFNLAGGCLGGGGLRPARATKQDPASSNQTKRSEGVIGQNN